MERDYLRFEVTPDSLLGCRFFDDQERAERARIARFCEGRVYRRAAEIIRHMDTGGDVFFILAGKVVATMLTMGGKVVTFQELANGEMFGEISALDGHPRSTSVFASCETKVIRMSGVNFRDLVAGNATLAERTMLRLCELSRHLCEKAYVPRAYSKPDQIRMEVYWEVRRRGVSDGKLDIDPAPTHLEIAQRVGTTREQVTRVLRDLSKRGLVSQVGRKWLIEDVAVMLEHLEDLLQPVDC